MIFRLIEDYVMPGEQNGNTNGVKFVSGLRDFEDKFGNNLASENTAVNEFVNMQTNDNVKSNFTLLKNIVKQSIRLWGVTKKKNTFLQYISDLNYKLPVDCQEHFDWLLNKWKSLDYKIIQNAGDLFKKLSLFRRNKDDFVYTFNILYTFLNKELLSKYIKKDYLDELSNIKFVNENFVKNQSILSKKDLWAAVDAIVEQYGKEPSNDDNVDKADKEKSSNKQSIIGILKQLADKYYIPIRNIYKPSEQLLYIITEIGNKLKNPLNDLEKLQFSNIVENTDSNLYKKFLNINYTDDYDLIEKIKQLCKNVTVSAGNK